MRVLLRCVIRRFRCLKPNKNCLDGKLKGGIMEMVDIGSDDIEVYIDSEVDIETVIDDMEKITSYL